MTAFRTDGWYSIFDSVLWNFSLYHHVQNCLEIWVPPILLGYFLCGEQKVTGVWRWLFVSTKLRMRRALELHPWPLSATYVVVFTHKQNDFNLSFVIWTESSGVLLGSPLPALHLCGSQFESRQRHGLSWLFLWCSSATPVKLWSHNRPWPLIPSRSFLAHHGPNKLCSTTCTVSIASLNKQLQK